MANADTKKGRVEGGGNDFKSLQMKVGTLMLYWHAMVWPPLTMCSVQVMQAMMDLAVEVPACYHVFKDKLLSFGSELGHMTQEAASGSDQVRCADVHLNDKHMQHPPMLTVFGLLL